MKKLELSFEIAKAISNNVDYQLLHKMQYNSIAGEMYTDTKTWTFRSIKSNKKYHNLCSIVWIFYDHFYTNKYV